MDPKSDSQTNNGIKNHDDLANLPPKSKVNDANTSSKQMLASNSAEPKQRVIKQIVSLDPKKLKALGIEKNILSALKKINGKDKAAIKSKPIVTVKNTEPSTPKNESPIEKPIISPAEAAILPGKPFSALSTGVLQQKEPDDSSPKKIQVLSNVLLNKNKLDLNIFPAIASSPTSPPPPSSAPSSSSLSTPVSRKHISYVSPVSRPSQVKRFDTDQVPFSQLSSTPIAIHHESVESLNVEKEIIDESSQVESPVVSPKKSSITSALAKKWSPVKYAIKSPLPVKKLEKSPIKRRDSDTSPQTSEVDSLKGFSLPELKCSQNQFNNLQNELHPKPSTTTTTTTSTIQIERDKESENVEEKPKTESSCEISAELSNTFTTSETISSVQCSDSESDLDELIVEAQLTIENDCEIKVTDETEEPREPKITPKKPRLIQKNLLNKLTEHVDNDRLIRDFLVSTINSFNRTGYDSLLSDSDSSDGDADVDPNIDVDVDSETTSQINDAEDDCKESKMVNVEANAEASDGNISTTEATDNDIVMEEVIDKDISATELGDENITANESTKCDTIEVNRPSPSETRKRKTSAKSEISSKRKKSRSINGDKNDDNTAVQTQKIAVNADDEPKIADASLEITQEVLNVEPSSNMSAPEQQDSNVAYSQPVAAKRGKKPKQSILNDYFAVQNSKLNATKQSLDEVIKSSASMKSSRYGRVIKPKSLDIETKTKQKPERKTRKELTNEREPEQEPELIIKTEIEDKPIAPKPLKKRRDKKGGYIIPPVDIPSIDTLNESVIEPIAESTNIEVKPSLVSSTPIIEQPPVRRKSGKQNKIQPIDVIAESPSHENMSIDVETPKMISKRRGRPPKKLLDSIEPMSQVSAIDSDVSHEFEDISIKQEIDTETPRKTLPKRKRDRRSKNVVIDDENVSSSDNVPIASQEDYFRTPCAEVPHLRHARTPSSTAVEECEMLPSTSESISTPTEVTITNDDSQNIEVIPKKRGRPRLTPKPDDEVASRIKFTCGNCQGEIPQNKWKAHEALHLGVTFRVGIDEPIDVEDSSNMGRLMIRFMKNNKIQYLKCPKCGEKKRSALGYISHVELCGLTQEEATSLKAECEYCKKLYRKVSLPSHQQTFCPVRRLEMAQQQADQMVQTAAESDQNVEVVYSESGRPKRMIKKVKPTSKPVDDFIKVGMKITGGTYKGWSNQLREENIIKCSNDNCTYSTADFDEMRKHFIRCRESILQCKICLKTERSRDAIVAHIETIHPDDLKIIESEEEDNDDDDDFKAGNQSSDSSDGESGDDENIELYKRNKSSKRKRSVPLKRIMEEDAPAYWEMLSAFYTRILNSRPGFHRKSYEWTKEFVEQNYDLSALALAGHMRSTFDIVRLPQREVNKFLGQLHSKSPKFRCQKQKEYQRAKSEITDETWNNLNLFESVKSTHINTESSIIFCGGKIITTDWIPFPTEYNGTQVLAICSESHGTKPISITNRVPMDKCRSLIQLWSVSTNAGPQIDKTEFMYGIAYEDGPICSMSFCPSDAYIASKRLAIVALPDTIGNINIISIPDNVSRAKTNTPTVIKLKPEIRLQLGLKKDENPPQTVTQMVWSRTKGHKVLCASYNTGLVVIWNFDHLHSTYLMQKGSTDGIPILLPQYSFMGSLSYITQLDLHSDDDDGSARWVLVGSLDRRIRLYDLQNPQLVPFISPVFKSRIISGTWPLHWPIYLTIIDAVLTRQNGGLHIKPILYTTNPSSNANLFNDCEASNLAFSDWLNTGIFGNEVGDLFMINFQQLLVADRYDESSEQKVLSCTDVFIDEQSTNDDSYDRFRVLFKDFDEKVFSPKLDTRCPEVNLPPYARITRVAINPNESHHKLYAIGYELGFCRIHFIPATIA